MVVVGGTVVVVVDVAVVVVGELVDVVGGSVEVVVYREETRTSRESFSDLRGQTAKLVVRKVLFPQLNCGDAAGGGLLHGLGQSHE